VAAVGVLVLSCDLLNRKQCEAMAADLSEIAVERQDQGGEECVCELVDEARQRAEPLLAEALAAANAIAGEADKLGPVAQAVVRIDHMNASKPYLAKLAKWASQLGLAGVVYVRGNEVTIKRGGRIEGISVVLEGGEEAISGWLTRLRSEYVDVDSRGSKCKERKATVLCRRQASDDQLRLARHLFGIT
jgi:solute carrier family 25 carnitine/acylcarnitine transporter 20/29